MKKILIAMMLSIMLASAADASMFKKGLLLKFFENEKSFFARASIPIKNEFSNNLIAKLDDIFDRIKKKRLLGREAAKAISDSQELSSLMILSAIDELLKKGAVHQEKDFLLALNNRILFSSYRNIPLYSDRSKKIYSQHHEGNNELLKNLLVGGAVATTILAAACANDEKVIHEAEKYPPASAGACA